MNNEVSPDLFNDIAFVKQVLKNSADRVCSDSAEEKFMRICCAIPGVTEDMVRNGMHEGGELIEPDPLFKHFRPDEVAECWEGVDQKLYTALWEVMISLPPMPTPDDIHTYDRSVAAYWNRFTKTDQKVLNQLADRNCR